jgi:hypothetical protein
VSRYIIIKLPKTKDFLKFLKNSQIMNYILGTIHWNDDGFLIQSQRPERNSIFFEYEKKRIVNSNSTSSETVFQECRTHKNIKIK